MGRVTTSEDVSKGSQLYVEHRGFVCWGAGVKEVLHSYARIPSGDVWRDFPKGDVNHFSSDRGGCCTLCVSSCPTFQHFDNYDMVNNP